MPLLNPFSYRGIAGVGDDLCATLAHCERERQKKQGAINLAVCRINAYTEEVDVLEPYKDRDTSKGVGTGFTISINGTNVIATAFHVIDNAVRTQITFEQQFGGRPLSAHILGGNPHIDVALIAIDAEEGVDLSSLPAIPVGVSDELQPLNTVSALGFALGQRHLQTAQGVVSGRKAIPNRIQVDVAINPGNSGGPLTLDGKVVGIVTSGMMHAQGLNYAAPIRESMQIFERVVQKGTRKAPHYEFGVDFNVHFAQMNDALIKQLPCNSGVYVTTANNIGEESEQLMAGDVLCGIDIPGQDFEGDIDMQMRIAVPWNRDRIEFHTVLDRLRLTRLPTGVDESEEVGFRIVRAPNMEPRRIKTTLGVPRHVLREVYPFCEPLRFVSRGGVVVQLLNENISKKSHFIKRCRFMDTPSIDMHSVLVVTHIAPSSPFSYDDAIAQYDYIEAVNNHHVSAISNGDALQRFADAWATEKDSDVITLRMRDGTMASASRKDIEEYESSAASKSVSTQGVISVCHYASGCSGVR